MTETPLYNNHAREHFMSFCQGLPKSTLITIISQLLSEKNNANYELAHLQGSYELLAKINRVTEYEFKEQMEEIKNERH